MSTLEDLQHIRVGSMSLPTENILITHLGYGLRSLNTRCKGGHVAPPLLSFVVLGVKSGSAFERVR